MESKVKKCFFQNTVAAPKHLPDKENYRYFLEKYSLYVHPVVETFAYCLMPNHLHLMVRVRGEGEVLEFLRLKKPTLALNLQGFENFGGLSGLISQQFSNLFNTYSKAYNKRYIS